MKKLVGRLALMAAVIMLLPACSSEEENWVEVNIPLPEMSRMVLTENISSDAHDVLKTDEFHYTNGMLASHLTNQSFIGQSIDYEVTGSYSGQTATFTSSTGNTSVYTLDNEGHASRCTYTSSSQTREYKFTYTNGYLTQLSESIDGAETATLTLNYCNGDLLSVSSNDNQINYQADKTVNYYHLPCLDLLEMYPLSFHQEAIYARLLGKPTQHLISRTAPEGNSEEYTDYTYDFDAKGKPTAIHKQTTYQGRGNDINLFPNKRDIRIEVE